MKLHLAFILSLACSSAVLAQPTHLRTNSLVTPLGIGSARPVFSWQNHSTASGWTQAAYQVLVATDAAHLAPGKANVWDSGRTESPESTAIRFAGATLDSGHRYLWAVRAWGSDGKTSPWMQSWFETGLLSAADWTAQWITRTDPADVDELAALRWISLPEPNTRYLDPKAPTQFLYNLQLHGVPRYASLHLLSPGTATTKVNGHFIAKRSGWTAFDLHVITSLLHSGANTIEIEYAPPALGGNVKDWPSAVAAAVHVIDDSGQERRIVSDEHWLAREKPDEPWKPAQVAGKLSAPFGRAVDGNSPASGPDRVTTGASLLRKSFSVEKRVASARLTMTALGAYRAYLNGAEIAPDSLLAPGWTDFHRRVEFQTYDVTAMVQRGENCLAAMLGGGWHGSPLTWLGVRAYPGPDALRAQLTLVYVDGSRETISTDETWRTTRAPILSSEIYGGETYDARQEQRGWNKPGFDASTWMNAAVLPQQPSTELTAQPDLPIHKLLELRPRHLTPADAQHLAVFDMGQNMVGNVRLHVQGERGSMVKLRFAERINPDGSIYTDNLRNADATDTYILSGDGEEVFTPSFTFHGFRYVEVSGVPNPTLATLEGLVFNSLPGSPSIRLTSSSAVLNKMNELGRWGQMGNFVSIPTDCPQRDERLGWMGDAGVFRQTGTFNFDIDAFTHKFMLDVEDAQTSEGNFTDVSPNILGPRTGAPGWGDAGIFIPYATWRQYGDREVIEQAWPAMDRWMQSILRSNPDHLRRQNLGANYGDWLAPDRATPKDLIATAYWALAAQEMTQMAGALHNDADHDRYQALHDSIVVAFRAAYIKADGTVSGGTQTAYVASLLAGIAPEEMKVKLTQHLVDDIAAHQDHLTTGFLGTPFLLAVLDQNGRADVAFKSLLADTYPSWGYMVSRGATTWWERWNGDTGDPGMNSYNHYAFGSVMSWVYRRAAGIDTDETAPGFRQLTIEPHFSAALPKLHVEYDSFYGTVISDWNAASSYFTVTIPANTSATVRLPDGGTFQIASGTHRYHISSAAIH